MYDASIARPEKVLLLSPKHGGFHRLHTTFDTYHHPSRTMPTRTLRASKLVNPCRQNHGQAKDVQAKAAHTKQGKSKPPAQQTGNALSVCYFDPFRDVRQIQGRSKTHAHSKFEPNICIENMQFEIMEDEQRSMDAAKNIRNLQRLCCVLGCWPRPADTCIHSRPFTAWQAVA